MNMKLPYYMAYPIPFPFDADRMERRDLEYMKSLYPALTKRLLPYVEEECDRMEYKCSMMYDEYPDKLQLQRMQKRILARILEKEDVGETRLLNDLTAVLLYQEICRRRMEERHLRRQIWSMPDIREEQGGKL